MPSTRSISYEIEMTELQMIKEMLKREGVEFREVASELREGGTDLYIDGIHSLAILSFRKSGSFSNLTAEA